MYLRVEYRTASCGPRQLSGDPDPRSPNDKAGTLTPSMGASRGNLQPGINNDKQMTLLKLSEYPYVRFMSMI